MQLVAKFTLCSFIAWALNPARTQMSFIYIESYKFLILIPKESPLCCAQAVVYNNPNYPSITSYFLCSMIGGGTDKYFGGFMV